MKISPLYRSWFTCFFLYNLIFLGLQIAYILSKSNSFIHAIPLPASVYFELIFTFLIHLGLYLLLSVLQTVLMWGLVQYPILSSKTMERWHITIWTLTVCLLITSNIYFFPLSEFSQLLLPELPHAILMALMLFSLFILSLLTWNTLFFTSKQYPKSCSSVLILFLTSHFYSSTTSIAENKQPNIILIGVDSLSPKRINPTDMPTLTRFIKNSVFFEESISPLARTYPAWSSILTGLYPFHHHARYNLMPPDLVKSERSVAWSLQKLGYQTIFATDDRRFNNLGKEFGFQTIIGPKIGINDMLLGTFNDFPLSNLLVNFPVGQWLFPYNYMNRASHRSYYPQTFDNALRQSLKSRRQTSPMFMAIHFTLPHWPYAWAESSPAEVGDEYSVNERGQLHQKALQRVDQQVSSLLLTLEQNGHLENSLVVLLSDHGEALYEKGSRQTSPLQYQGSGTSLFADYLKRKTSTALEMSAGHGSDLLSADQYHCLLAFKVFKNKQLTTKPKIIKTRVALIDLAPTIQDFLGKPTAEAVDGLSLLKTILSDDTSLPDRRFIMESGMLPNQFLTREKARILGQQYFTVDPHSEQLHLRKSELRTLDALKLYAVIEGDWVLALYPDDGDYIPVTLNLRDGQWTDDLNTKFAKESPAANMLAYLKQFYKNTGNYFVSIP